MNFNKITLTGAIALIICTTNGFAQVKKKPAPASKAKPKTTVAATPVKANALPMDPEVLIGKLPNGLTYYIRTNSTIKSRASAFLVTKAGSLVETDAQQGAAHFIEHMAFNGTRDFPKSELQKYIKDRGASLSADLGATTSFDQSMYQLALPTDTVGVFEKGFKILANWAGSITFDDADIEKERAVLIEEASTGGKTAQERLQKQSIPFFLKNSRYALRLPAGKEDVLKTISAATLKSYYQDWYRPNMQAVIIVGDFDAKRVEQLIKDNFSALKNPATVKSAPAYAVIPTPGTSVSFATDKDFLYLYTQIITLHPQNVIKTTADYMQSIRVNLFNQMLNTRMSEAVSQRSAQLIGADANYGSFLGKQNAFTAIAVTRTGLEPAIKAVVAETERARKFGFTLTELERAKQKALVSIGNAFQGKNQTISSSFISQYVQHFVNNDPIPGIDFEYSFYTDNIGKITLSEINALATSYITPQNRAIRIQAPDSEKSKLPDEATLLTWITDAGKNVAAYVDETDEPFLTKLPVAGKVVNTVQDTVISITKLTLSNGVKVILKPTQFTNGQILINGYSFGGTSLASNQDLLSATFADKMIPLSGVGDLTQAQLDKRLTSKQINISPYISEITQGISGSSVPADFESAMQLLYLYFTQPHKDAAVWQDITSQSKSTIAQRSVDPLSAYQDTITGILNSHNPRAMPATFDKVDVASIDKAYDFYKNRFADASGFTFTFVGSFEVDAIIPFLETYLGSLPATNKKETYKNLSMHPQTGQISRTFTKGNAENASIQLTYSGSYIYNETNNIQIDALESVLNAKLTARLTEKEGAFSPGASINYVKIPEGRYEITVFVDAKPAEAEKVANLVLDEISKLKQTGADAKEIERFTILDARATQGNFRQNAFWAGYLSTSSQNEEDPDNLLHRIQKLSDVTPQSTKDAANKYLSVTNMIKLILLPEKK